MSPIGQAVNVCINSYRPGLDDTPARPLRGYKPLTTGQERWQLEAWRGRWGAGVTTSLTLLLLLSPDTGSTFSAILLRANKTYIKGTKEI